MTMSTAIDRQETGGGPDDKVGAVCGEDRLRRVVQALLALYLLPALLLVLAVGGILIAATAAGRLAVAVVRALAMVVNRHLTPRARAVGPAVLRVVRPPLTHRVELFGREAAPHEGRSDRPGAGRVH
jgi:hypothetical protein